MRSSGRSPIRITTDPEDDERQQHAGGDERSTSSRRCSVCVTSVSGTATIVVPDPSAAATAITR